MEAYIIIVLMMCKVGKNLSKKQFLIIINSNLVSTIKSSRNTNVIFVTKQ